MRWGRTIPEGRTRVLPYAGTTKGLVNQGSAGTAKDLLTEKQRKQALLGNGERGGTREIDGVRMTVAGGVSRAGDRCPTARRS
jgi:hypothetical protein